MEQNLKEILWKQFGASIDMLENAMQACPAQLWDKEELWYRAYHTLFYLDYYLTEEPEKFAPPPPFTLSEFDPKGGPPGYAYSKEELLGYIAHCRQKCHDLIAGLSNEKAAKVWANQYRSYPMLELLLYNMRHVQHHAAQLNLLLRQEIKDAPQWVSRTKMKL
jgi:hypothetical protein